MGNASIKMSSNRSFGLLFFIVFLAISLWPLISQEDLRLWAFILAIIFFVLGILNSKFLTPLNKLWMKFGIFLGSIVSPFVMGVVFFMVVTVMKEYDSPKIDMPYAKAIEKLDNRRNTAFIWATKDGFTVLDDIQFPNISSQDNAGLFKKTMA